MATMVCRGLQSCLDSHLVEQRTFMLVKFSSPKPQFSHPFELPLKPSFSDPSATVDEDDKCDIQEAAAAGNGDSGGWTFFKSLSTDEEPANGQEIYVHPLAKLSNSTSLSDKSLKLCTENLGNETGTDIIENNIFSPELDGGNSLRKDKRKPHSNSQSPSPSPSPSQSHQMLKAKKLSSQNFPPPLTTIRESESFRVKPHREEGRLIIEAVKTPARQSCFQAERSQGRLRLCFLKPKENEESNADDGEEIDAETATNETACTIKEGNSKSINGLINLEQFSIATC